MAFAHTAPLRREIAAALRQRPFAIRFWDGTIVEATAPDAPSGPQQAQRVVTFSFRSPEALAHVIRAPGELGLGPRLRAGADRDRRRGEVAAGGGHVPGAAAVSGADGEAGRGAGPRLRAGQATADPVLGAASDRRAPHDRRAVRYHYDAGNEFFALFLDASMTYSCAYFRGGARTLQDAQQAKLGLVCTKLDLQPGERVLDVGCGWGSFAIHAAANYRVNVLGAWRLDLRAARAGFTTGWASVYQVLASRPA